MPVIKDPGTNRVNIRVFSKLSKEMALHVGTVTLAIVVALVPGCSSKVGFPKDQKMDVLFPPYIVPAGHGIPDGHLRPLGEFLMPAEIVALSGYVLIFRVKRA